MTRLVGLQRRIRAGLRVSLLRGWTLTTRSIAYGPADRQVLDVMRPRWPRDEPRPVVVTFHGGGWTEGSRESLVDRVCRRYLERGFVVVNVEYRRGIARASTDARRALEWTFEHVEWHGGDRDRVIVTGESAGAHIALLAAFACSPRIRAAINFYAVTDLMRFLHDPCVLGADELRTLSPLDLVTPKVCPVLSIHGTADAIVPLDHTERLTRRLRQVGVDAEELIIEGGDHGDRGFTEPELDAIYERIFRFVRRAATSR